MYRTKSFFVNEELSAAGEIFRSQFSILDLVSFKSCVVQKDRFSKIVTIRIGKTVENDGRPRKNLCPIELMTWINFFFDIAMGAIKTQDSDNNFSKATSRVDSCHNKELESGRKSQIRIFLVDKWITH